MQLSPRSRWPLGYSSYTSARPGDSARKLGGSSGTRPQTISLVGPVPTLSAGKLNHSDAECVCDIRLAVRQSTPQRRAEMLIGLRTRESLLFA